MTVNHCTLANAVEYIKFQEVEEEEIGALEEQWVIESLPKEYMSLLSR